MSTLPSLPTTSYVIIDELGGQRLIVIDHSHHVQKVLNVLHRELQLKLERVGNDYKLALVTDSDEPCYYYYNGNDTCIDTIDRIPQSSTNGTHVRVYDYDTCSIAFKSLGSSRVLIDPKDVISSKNMSLIGSRLDIRIGDNVFKESQFEYKFYKSVEIHNSAGSKVGMLNNVVPTFDQRSDNFKLSPFHEIKRLNVKNSYFATEKLGSNYVGCISDENSECKNFYDLKPDFVGYNYSRNLDLYPYYYNLENFGNFLEVDMKLRELIDLEERVRILEDKIEKLRGDKGEPGVSNIPGPKGDKGSRGERGFDGFQGFRGEKGEPGLSGSPGLPGKSGIPGSKGEPGVSNIPGPKGDKGELGFGEKGQKGAPGLSGLSGAQGPIGSKGEPGQAGKDGTPGPKGADGTPGTPGLKGDRGTPGLKGEAGLKGAMGALGNKGDTGSVGPKGADGVTPSIDKFAL